MWSLTKLKYLLGNFSDREKSSCVKWRWTGCIQWPFKRYEHRVKQDFWKTPQWSFCHIYIKICVCFVISFWNSIRFFFSNFKLYCQKNYKKQREKQFIARSDRAECVDLINFFISNKAAHLNATTLSRALN